MATTRMSFSYPEEYKEKLLVLAKQDARTLSSYVQKIFMEHLEEKEMIKTGTTESTDSTERSIKKRPRKRKA